MLSLEPGIAIEDRSVPTIKLLLTVEEAAQALSIGRTLLYDLLMRREIFSVKVGRVRRVPVDALRSYVARRLADAEGGS
jgi:excisionase family DNA binding protein